MEFCRPVDSEYGCTSEPDYPAPRLEEPLPMHGWVLQLGPTSTDKKHSCTVQLHTFMPQSASRVVAKQASGCRQALEGRHSYRTPSLHNAALRSEGCMYADTYSIRCSTRFVGGPWCGLAPLKALFTQVGQSPLVSPVTVFCL